MEVPEGLEPEILKLVPGIVAPEMLDGTVIMKELLITGVKAIVDFGLPY